DLRLTATPSPEGVESEQVDRDGEGAGAPGDELAGVAGLVLVEHERAGPFVLGRVVDHPPAPGVGHVADPDGHTRLRLQVADPVGAVAGPREQVERVAVTRVPDLDLVVVPGDAAARGQVAVVVVTRHGSRARRHASAT